MVIKMKDLIKGQNDMLREKFVHRRLHEADPPKPPEGGGEEKPPEPQKLKIDIPDSPFEPDVNQIKDKLKQMLKHTADCILKKTLGLPGPPRFFLNMFLI